MSAEPAGTSAPRRAGERAAASRGDRVPLAVRDWIDAGQQLMIAEGIGGVKLSRLTAHLGVTSGSFYHHFVDFADYLGRLADHYGVDNVDRMLAAIEVITDPAGRIRTLSSLPENLAIVRLDSAMRVWATSSERARAAVQRFDERFLALLESAFSELGFPARDARLRARFALAAGVGQPFLFGHPSQPGDAADALDLLLDLST